MLSLLPEYAVPNCCENLPSANGAGSALVTRRTGAHRVDRLRWPCEMLTIAESYDHIAERRGTGAGVKSASASIAHSAGA